MNYYRMNFEMSTHHGYDITTLESMLPWERMIYIDLMAQYIDKINLERTTGNDIHGRRS